MDTSESALSEPVFRKWQRRLADYAEIARLNRPAGALLLLWPTLWALWLAGAGQPSPRLLIIFVLGTFLMRGAGCAINDFADRDFDGHVKRTADRPIPSGRVSSREAIGLFAFLALVAFALVLTTNRLTVLLSFAGLVVAGIYPFLKRVTHLPQLWLGIAFSWGVPMAFAAETNTVPPVAWLLLVANWFWVLVYDTVYAMVDRDDDIRIGIRSTAILFGQRDYKIVAASHAISLVLLGFVWWASGMNLWFWAGFAIACVFAVFQFFLYRSRDRDSCFQAFLNSNWFGAAVFGGFVLGLLPVD